MRRPGVENGPSQYLKSFKNCRLRAIRDENREYLDLFGQFGSDIYNFKEESFENLWKEFSKEVKEDDLFFAIGGGNHLLNSYSKLNRKTDKFIKISPNLSRGGSADKIKTNATYITHLDSSIREKLHHFAILDSLTTQREKELVENEDKSQITFFDPKNESNCSNLAALIDSLPADSHYCLIFDCESFGAAYFPGMSVSNATGLSDKELLEIFSFLGKTSASANKARINSFLITNFNSAVESRRSTEILLYLIFSFLQNLSKSQV